MVVSRGEGGKTLTLTTTTALDHAIGNRIRARGVRMAKQKKHLCVTTVAGRYRRVGAISKRAVQFATRRNRIARVRQAGGPAHKVFRHARVPSLLYGVKVMGMADANLGQLRQSVSTAMRGNAKGRSTFSTLLANDKDQGTLANSSPILAWAQTRQEAEEDQSLVTRLRTAWKRWVLQVGFAKVPWQHVRGPAGAFVATVQRLGWMTQDLHELHHYVRNATEQGLQDAWLAKWGAEFNLQSIFAARLFAKGVVPDAICKARNMGEGTDRHRPLFGAAGSFVEFATGFVEADGSLLYGKYVALRRGGRLLCS
ncbi:unnamed protein product [Prorocentrum cordatum]|uniref:Uncharacterized protein n=1 Tax=Prorocentrum cordatum TaxID=2364126 RepID=A0ABN9PDF9_9DINO|nr:unnamed protein product [Polarella glacialis]